jgi:hypothetical protein
MRLVNSGEAKCPLVYGIGEVRFEIRGHFSLSVGSYVSAYIWERNLHGGHNPYGKSISVGPFGYVEWSCGVRHDKVKSFPLELKRGRCLTSNVKSFPLGLWSRCMVVGCLLHA